jgi:hypothetical protein
VLMLLKAARTGGNSSRVASSSTAAKRAAHSPAVKPLLCYLHKMCLTTCCNCTCILLLLLVFLPPLYSSSVSTAAAAAAAAAARLRNRINTTGCVAGQYLVNDPVACTDCPVGSYCPGSTATQSVIYSCNWANNTTTNGLTTKAVTCWVLGASLCCVVCADMLFLPCVCSTLAPCSTADDANFAASKHLNLKSCCSCSYSHPSSAVNKPSYRYVPSTVGKPSAVLCGANFYSAGFNKQKGCTRCPSGLETDPAATGLQTSAVVCSEWLAALEFAGVCIPCSTTSSTSKRSCRCAVACMQL